MKLRILQRWLALGAFGFIMFLGWQVTIGSEKQENTPAALSGVDRREVELDTDDSPGEGSSIEIREFFRVELKDGTPSWQVKASEAKHLPEQNLTLVKESEVWIFEEDGSKTTLRSDAARLVSEGAELNSMELEGNVFIERASGTVLTCESARFENAAQLIKIPGDVQITGKGFLVRGRGLRYDLEKELLALSEKVETVLYEKNKKL